MRARYAYLKHLSSNATLKVISVIPFFGKYISNNFDIIKGEQIMAQRQKVRHFTCHETMIPV